MSPRRASPTRVRTPDIPGESYQEHRSAGQLYSPAGGRTSCYGFAHERGLVAGARGLPRHRRWSRRPHLRAGGGRHGSVLVLTKRQPSEGSTQYAQGGIASVLGQDDEFELHVQDTLVAGAGLCKPEAVEVTVREGPGSDPLAPVARRRARPRGDRPPPHARGRPLAPPRRAREGHDRPRGRAGAARRLRRARHPDRGGPGRDRRRDEQQGRAGRPEPRARRLRARPATRASSRPSRRA